MAERPIKIIPSATARPRLPGPQTLEGGDWISLPWEWRREGGCVPVLFSLETLGPGDHGGQILRKVGGGCLEEFGRLCNWGAHQWLPERNSSYSSS